MATKTQTRTNRTKPRSTPAPAEPQAASSRRNRRGNAATEAGGATPQVDGRTREGRAAKAAKQGKGGPPEPAPRPSAAMETVVIAEAPESIAWFQRRAGMMLKCFQSDLSLRMIAHLANRPLTVRGLCREAKGSEGAVKDIIARWKSCGYIGSTPDPEKERGEIYDLTPIGRSAYQSLQSGARAQTERRKSKPVG